MLPWVPERGTTQGKQAISPERLGPKFPDLHAAAGRRAHRGARGSPASAERMVTALEDGEEDELPTAGLAHEVEKVAHGGLNDLRTTSNGGQSGMPSRARRRGLPQSKHT